MAENLYFMGNGYSALTVLTGSAGGPASQPTVAGKLQPLLQISSPTTRHISIVEYGVPLTGSPAGATVLLFATDTTNPVTGATAGIIAPYSNPDAPTSLCTSGTSNCCYYTA